MTSRLECSICFHAFDDFKHLPKLVRECNHTFCYTCLDLWVNRPEGVRDTCPMCRTRIDINVEIPTNLDLLALYEKKKSNPKCSCTQLRDFFCPMCMSQNYVMWEELRERDQQTFCIGCACNHTDDTEHQVESVTGKSKPPVMTTINMVSEDCEVALKPKRAAGDQKTKIVMTVAIVVALLSATGLTIALSQLI